MTSLALDTSYISIVFLLCSAGKYYTYSKRPFLSSVTLLAIVGAVQALPLEKEGGLYHPWPPISESSDCSISDRMLAFVHLLAASPV